MIYTILSFSLAVIMVSISKIKSLNKVIDEQSVLVTLLKSDKTNLIHENNKLKSELDDYKLNLSEMSERLHQASFGVAIHKETAELICLEDYEVLSEL